MRPLTTARAGFSLLEIVIAITIAALVGTIATVSIMSLRKRSYKDSTKIILENVKTAIETYRADTGSYPAALTDLKVRPTEERVAKRWEGPYIEKELVDAYGRDLVYTLNPKGTQPPYELYSWGPNGEGSPQEEWMSAIQEA